MPMLTFPNAKINIGLYVTGKRPDGYHDLETIFYPVQLKDGLEIIDHNVKDNDLKISGLGVGGANDNNLVWKAYYLLQQDFPEKIKPLHIFLHKVIPMGAGMGGGSADGAFMLRMMNDLFQLGLSTQELEQYALQLGSDCPFFIRNQPAFATGRGELLSPVTLDLSSYRIQLICPAIHVNTAAAFKGIMPATPAFDLKNITDLPISEWKENISNDFEQTVFVQHPILKEIKKQLYAQGALYAAMSGTGSTVYGIFEKGKQAVIHTDIPFAEYFG